MASLNQCLVAGQVRWSKPKEIGKGWGVITARVHLPIFQFERMSETITIDDPMLWVDIKCNFENGAVKEQRVLNGCTNEEHIFISGGVISDFETFKKDEHGKPITNGPKERRFKFETSASSCSFSSQPDFQDLNLCTFSGKVLEVDANGSMVLQTSYASKDGRKFRHIPIIGDPMSITTDMKDSYVMCIGKVCGKTPNKDQRLYVIPEKIIRL